MMLRKLFCLFFFVMSITEIYSQCNFPVRDCDRDGVSNDLDQDNDGISDLDEGKCDGLFDAGWFFNSPANTFNQDGVWRNHPIGSVTYGGAHNNIVVATGNPLTFGSGINHTVSSTRSTLTGVGTTSLANAKANNDYIQYSFKTPSSIPAGIAFSRLGFANWNINTSSYKLSVEVSTDAFATSTNTFLLANNIPIVPSGSGSYEFVYVQTNNILTTVGLSPSTTYTFRVYVYGAATATTQIIYDDFQFGTCKSRDTDNDNLPDYLDWDSDNDNCFDGVEGDENVKLSNLNTNGSINSTTDTTNGFPTLVNTGGAADIGGDVGQGIGSSQSSTVNACVCYQNQTTSGTTLDTKVGISGLRIDNSSGWPEVRKGAWIALESASKGFVINRIPTTAQVNALSNPIEGMMVYDEEADCLKVYSIKNNEATPGWHCFNKQGCPSI